MLSHIVFYSPFIYKLSLEYFDLVLSKTRFSSHLSFLSRCLQFKVIPNGFKSTFTLHFNSPSHLVTKACYDHSRRLMRIDIDALVKHILFLDSKMSVVRSNFLTACPVVLQQDIMQFIRSLKSRLYSHLRANTPNDNVGVGKRACFTMANATRKYAIGL